jgi:hypothetical protein
MGQGTDDLMDTDSPEELEREVEDIREDMTDIVSELDRRGHEAFDWRMQLRKHAAPLIFTGLGLLVVAAGKSAFSARRRRRNNRPLAKARRMREALARMIAHPELVAQPRPSIANRALAAAVGAAAGSVAKALTDRAARRIVPAP